MDKTSDAVAKPAARLRDPKQAEKREARRKELAEKAEKAEAERVAKAEESTDDTEQSEEERLIEAGRLISSPGAPYDVARDYRLYLFTSDAPPLVHWRSTFYEFRSGYYAEVDNEVLRERLYRWLADKKYKRKKPKSEDWIFVNWHPGPVKVSAVVDALRAHAALPFETKPRSWIDVPAEVDFHGDLHLIVPTSEGLLHIGEDGQEEWTPCTPDYFCLSAVQLTGDGNGHYHTYLKEIGLQDDDIEYYGELNGAAMANWWPEQKAHMKLGPPRSGKGSLKKLTAELVGYGATSISMDALGRTLEKEILIGTLYISLSEARGSSRDSAEARNFFLRASGGDVVNIGRKNKRQWNGTLDALWDFDTNSLNAFRDASGASATRFVGMYFPKSFLGHEDRKKVAALLGDIRTAFSEAVAGLHRLVRNGRFTETDSWREHASRFFESTSIESRFLNAHGKLGAEYYCQRDIVWSQWNTFCDPDHENIRAGAKASWEEHIRTAADTQGVKLKIQRLGLTRQAELGCKSTQRLWWILGYDMYAAYGGKLTDTSQEDD